MASLTLYLVLCGLIAVSSAQSTTVNVSFAETSYNVLENAGSISLQVDVVSSAGAPDIVTVTINGFLGRDPMDFNISTSNMNSQPLTFDVVDDNVLGSDRIFEVTLSSSDSSVMIEPPSTATVNITEDDMVTIGFAATEYTVFEGEDVTLCVNLTNGTLAAGRTVIVTLATDDIIGSGGSLLNMDFESVRVDLTFSNTVITQCEDVPTIFNADMTAMPFNVNLTTDEAPSTVSLSPAVTTVTIQDVVTPSIMMQPMSMDAAFPDSNVTFTVMAMGGALSYQWSRNGVEINGATEATLTIVGVIAERDEGIFSCFISNRAGNVTTVNVSLTVLRRPTITLTAPPAALLDQEITITCTAAVDATITLMVVNSAGTNVTSLTDVATTGNSRSVNLTVTSLGRHTVTCEADNQGLIEMETAQFYGITIEVGDVVAGVTATAVFFCNVTGATDGVMYNWRQTQNGVLPSTTFPSVIYENRVSGRTTSMLTISNLRDLEENYDYTCYVSIANVEIANATGTLTSPGPRILVGPEDKVLQAEETLALNCTGMNNEDATQPLTIIWMFIAFDPQNTQNMYTVDDSAVTEERMSDNLTVISFLTINNVPPTGGGVYGCVVFNRELVQRVVENATVNVLFTPQINFMASPNLVQTGRTTLLTCTVTAEPTANSSQIVRIMPNGEEMVVASQNNTGGERVFVVRYMLNARFLRDDGAVFQCQATNDNGPATADIRITVQARPGEINHANVSAQLASLDVATITWTIPPSNNADITGYTLIVCARIIPNDTECSSGTLFNVSVPIMGGGDRPGSRRSFNLTGLTTGKEYEIVIRAENLVGMQMSPELGGGFKFNSAFPDDGQVINVDFIPAETRIIVTWNLPALALATNNLAVSFNVMYYNISIPTAITSETVDYVPMRLEQGFSTNMLEADSSLYVFVIRADYTNPNLVSSLATLNNARTLAVDAPLLTGPLAEVNDTVDDNDELTVSWPTPSNTNFLVAYSVSFTTSSARRRRQTSPMEVSADMTMTTLPFTAFTNYTVNVDAIYEPPGGTRVVINLLPPTTFTTPERQSSPPRNVMATNEDVLKIRFSWIVPETPNGIITSYRVTLGGSGRGIGGTLIDGMTSHVTANLSPNAVYTYTVKAINGYGDGMASQEGMIRVGFGVVQPVITGTSVGTSGSPRFTIDTQSFSVAYGGLGLYKVVVVRGSAVDPASISDTSLAPAGESSFNYYVAFVGNAVQQARNTFIIGDGIRTVDAGKTFTNPPPDVGVNYFVFIRLYSSIDPAVFNNSELTGVLMIARPIDPAVIIAPIAVIAGILLIILVVLLVVVFLFTRPRRGYTIAATEDGVHRKKRGGALELRRTRLFSPVVNVPVPDVFTSAGQPTTLVCEASGTPAPEVAWTQNNEPLDKERFIQLADCSLFINDTDLKDEGAYIITATNSAGTAEQMVRVTVIRPSPPESDPDHPPIKVGEFTEKIALLRANDDEGLEDEYSEVEPDVTFTSYAAKININKNKNRYINIIPYDHSRVVLSLQDNTPGSDYINASYIDGFNRPNAYIATQGPQPSTFPDFWRMIWEFDCPTIVMVTNLKEEDKLKCHQYWPNYGTTTYGNIQVTLKGVENLAEYSIRTFHITPIAGQSRVQMPLREVKQFHFLVWPDHGVPQFATPLLSFRKRVAKYHPDKKGPMVVHCSAGVGRTGTFITIDTMLRQMEAEGVIDIFNFVRHMRFRRNYMVQTGPQYVFIHDALLEAIMCGDNSIPAPELRKRFEVLRDVDPESNKSRLQLQFENLNSNSPQDDDFDCTIASLPDNMAKNRFRVHLPANDFRVPLGAPPSRSEGGDDDDDEDEKEKEEPDYICASFADGYRQRNAFIITQAPMSNTTGDFWRMIWEQKSAAIVMLTELEEDGKEMSVKYWPGEVGEASLFGSFQLELSEDEKDKGDYVTRKFKLSHVDAPQDCRIVTQFHFTKWPRNSTPSKPQSVIDLIDEIQRVQRKSGNQPITIHCDDGVSRTGAFCTLYSVLERVKVDQVVDVYLATKTLRIQRAGLLETLDQYTFVHRAVIEFLDSFSDYQNFK